MTWKTYWPNNEKVILYLERERERARKIIFWRKKFHPIKLLFSSIIKCCYLYRYQWSDYYYIIIKNNNNNNWPFNCKGQAYICILYSHGKWEVNTKVVRRQDNNWNQGKFKKCTSLLCSRFIFRGCILFSGQYLWVCLLMDRENWR